LIHVLLYEVVGEEAPPDLSGRILAAASARGRWLYLRRAAALVAVLAAGAAVAVLWQASGYPRPRAAGDYSLINGAELTRGALLEAGTGKARVELGGYCSVSLAPRSRLAIEGTPRDEQVRLAGGQITCEVDRGRGQFQVVTDVGRVSVTGTRFFVQLDEGGEQMETKRMFVKVLVGAVMLTTAYAAETLQAGEERLVTEQKEGRIVGTVLARNKSGTHIRVRIEKVLAGNKKLQGKTVPFHTGLSRNAQGRAVPDAARLKAFGTLRKGDRVEIQYSLAQGFAVGSLNVMAGAAEGVIDAGKPTYKPREGDAWREHGRIVGPLRDAPDAEIDILKGDDEVASVRIRSGATVYESGMLAPGVYTLRVSANGYKTLEVEGLEVRARHDLFLAIEFSKPAGKGVIDAGKPTYKPREGDAWRERGRIAGPLRNAPDAEIDILKGDDEIQSIRIRKGATGYESDMLVPGVYTLRVSAEGYDTLEVEGLEVKARHDLFLVIEFSEPRGTD
jgi:hypothetical protein